MTRARISSLRVGRAAPLGAEGVLSGFHKSPVTGPVSVKTLGLTGDEQADLAVHGGPEKAVYAYPASHYPLWLVDHPHHAALLQPGGFGENLTVGEMVESDICVGDVHRIGTARLQVCQPRAPCFKLALYFEDNRIPRAMVRSGRAGWYYRVLEEGAIQAGDEIHLVDRPNPAFRFDRLVDILYSRRASYDEYTAMSGMPGLASSLSRWAGAQLREA
ncbi:MAG: MOSC domain-containing protein [Sphingomicrobium sp.]